MRSFVTPLTLILLKSPLSSTKSRSYHLKPLLKDISSARSFDYKLYHSTPTITLPPSSLTTAKTSKIKHKTVKPKTPTPAPTRRPLTLPFVDFTAHAFIPPLASAQAVENKSISLLRFDGGSRGNPGLTGSGFVLYSVNPNPDDADGKDMMLFEYHAWGGAIEAGNGIVGGREGTNNEAEYYGLIKGLEFVVDFIAANATTDVKKTERIIEKLYIEGDSELIVKQVRGVYKCKALNLQPFHKRACELLDRCNDLLEYGEENEGKSDSSSNIGLRHIYREVNGRADEMVNVYMDSAAASGEVV